MILPQIHGIPPATEFFIYSACDQNYFDEFAVALINSVRANSPDHLHLHIFNPRTDQLEYCGQQSQVTVTYEYIEPQMFDCAAARLSTADPALKTQRDRTLNAMKKGQDVSVQQRIQKTYYACARFIRLAELAAQSSFMSMDVDAVVRRPIPRLAKEYDFYLHKITGTKARILAGGMYVNAQGRSTEFLNHYAQQLRHSLESDQIYWSLDQDILDQVVPNYVSGHLPMSMIDWDMHPSSCIWTAKGTRKNLPQFISEKKKYSS